MAVTNWLIDKSAYTRLVASPDAQAWVDANAGNAQLAVVKDDLQAALALLKSSTDTLLAQAGDNPDAISAGAVEYLDIFGYVIYAWLWAQMLAATDGRDDDFVKAKRITGQYYFQRVLPKAQSLFGPSQRASLFILPSPEGDRLGSPGEDTRCPSRSLFGAPDASPGMGYGPA